MKRVRPIILLAADSTWSGTEVSPAEVPILPVDVAVPFGKEVVMLDNGVENMLDEVLGAAMEVMLATAVTETSALVMVIVPLVTVPTILV